MTWADFLRLPPGIRVLVLVMFWPAIWSAALMTVALAGDVLAPIGKRASPALRRIV